MVLFWLTTLLRPTVVSAVRISKTERSSRGSERRSDVFWMISFLCIISDMERYIQLAFWHCSHSLQSRVYVTVWCPSVCLSSVHPSVCLIRLPHVPAAGLLLWPSQQMFHIDWLLQKWWANAGSVTLSACVVVEHGHVYFVYLPGAAAPGIDVLCWCTSSCLSFLAADRTSGLVDCKSLKKSICLLWFCVVD